METDHLLQEFPPVSTQSWEELIRKDLKGADYAKKLIWQTEEGLAVKPYYRAEDVAGLEFPDAPPSAFPYARGARSTGDWRIREEIDVADCEEANRAAHGAVLAGTEEITFCAANFENASELNVLLANLDEIPVHFENAGEPQLRLLIGRMNARKRLAPVSTGWNPLANLDFAAEVIAATSPALVPFTIHGEEFEESGATAVEEVGFTLAAAIEYMAEMQERNVQADRVADSIAFSFSIGSNFFFQIAKLRAFRMMWAQVVESFGGTRESAKPEFTPAPRAGMRRSTLPAPTFCAEPPRLCRRFSAARTLSPWRPSMSVTRGRTRPAAVWRGTPRSFSSMKRCCRESLIPEPGRTVWNLSPISLLARAGKRCRESRLPFGSSLCWLTRAS